jgi:putative N6-adenine-specific DNA methylase/tRNA (guanine6-N2)-methyltransferase
MQNAPRHLLIVDPGLEDVAAEEVRDAIPGAVASEKPYGLPGHVAVDAAGGADLRTLATVHHLIAVAHEGTARSLDDVRAAVAATDFPTLEHARSFRVTSALEGEQPFDRRELAGAAGAALVNRYGTAVDLEGFEVNVRADLFGERLVLGVQLTRESLGNRIRRAKSLRSALKPTIAAALVRMAGAHRGTGRLIDPLCGTGTIPIEAARANPALEILASDWDAPTVDVAQETFGNHGLAVPVAQCDARDLAAVHDAPFDYIVTDPPYGVRQAKRIRLGRLYGPLLQSFERVLADGGRVVVVVVKRHAFLEAVGTTGLEVVAERVVDAGGLPLAVYSLERRP